MNSKDIFTKYYTHNIWNGDRSKSGPGSDIEQTMFLIRELEFLLKKYEIKTVLDIPCGDFNWMKHVNLDNIIYHGADIVDQLICDNKTKYEDKNISFSVLDLVNDTLPKADLVIVRDCFVHLQTSDVLKALNNIKESGSKYLLTTHFSWKHQKANEEINTGDWRRINLELPPYNLARPIDVIVEGNTYSQNYDKTMSLWQIKDIEVK